MSSPAIAGGQVSGWKPGSPYITVVSSDWGAIDEPHAASAGGNVVYWNLCCDRTAGAFDVTIPNTLFYSRYQAGHRPPTGPTDKSREWQYFGYNLEELIPGYNIGYFAPGKKYDGVLTNYGGPNGVYGFHNDVNPPIPYGGMVYMHRSNSVIAFGVTDSEPVALPLISSPSGTAVVNDPGPLTTPYLQTRLVEEVDKILQAGHLRPGYISHGLFDLRGMYQCGSDLTEYWHDPSETMYTLLTALPLLPPDRQALVKTYLQNEFAAYPATTVDHIGWSSGSAREAFDLPPEVTAFFASNSAPKGPSSVVWKLNPFRYYALWKYAEVFGGADVIYSAVSKDKVKPPADIILLTFPFAHNAYIAGLIGYLNLEQMAGQPASTDLQAELARLLQLRAGMFTKNSYFGAIYSTAAGAYCRTSSVSSNFMYMVPELASYLNANALGPVQDAVAEYTRVAPHWFVSFASEGYAEDPKALLYDTIGIFNAKAMILGAPPEELVKYLDVPGFARGDLYYIQRLAMILQAGTPNASEPPNTPEPPEPPRGDMPENSYGR